MMIRFFFHSREGSHSVPDDEGQLFPTTDAAIANAVREARALMAHQVRNGRLNLHGEIEIIAHEGVRVVSIAFDQALEVRLRPPIRERLSRTLTFKAALGMLNVVAKHPKPSADDERTGSTL